MNLEDAKQILNDKNTKEYMCNLAMYTVVDAIDTILKELEEKILKEVEQ